jgi:hypothetical protein
MKVIQELVAYFERRGRLPPRDVRRLLEQGYLAAEAPASFVELADPVGSTYYFRVTGKDGGTAWGTDVYSGDSALGVAAVHMGLVKPGDQAVVKVVSVPPPPRFVGSSRHGVTTHDFGRYGSAFTIAAV